MDISLGYIRKWTGFKDRQLLTLVMYSWQKTNSAYMIHYINTAYTDKAYTNITVNVDELYMYLYVYITRLVSRTFIEEQ